MAVQPHEGSFNILYRDFDFPAGTGFAPGYMARPDQSGSFPLLVILAGIDGIRPYLKAMCRGLARHGFAVIAPDLSRGTHPGIHASIEAQIASYNRLSDRRAMADVDAAIRFAVNDDAGWADPGPHGLVGIDLGGRLAIVYGAHHPEVGALTVAYAPLAGDEDRDYPVAEVLGSLAMPVLGLYGDADVLVPAEGVDAAQQMNPHGQWLLYEGVGHGFLDDDAATYHGGAAADGLARIVALMSTHLAVPAPR